MRVRAAAVCLLLLATPAFAEDTPETAEETPVPEPLETLSFADQEIGAKLGLQVGAIGVSAGGFHFGGEYLYRLSDTTWFDGEASFAFGGTSPACYLDRDQSTVCNPGGLGGIGFQLDAGARFVLLVPKKIKEPLAYAKVGVGLHITSLPEDGVVGIGVPVFAGGGGRYRMSKGVSLMSEVIFAGGPAWYGDGIGLIGTLQITLTIGVEFAL